jgi:hypothetical protein
MIELRMPEGGAEQHSVYETYHRCPQANALKRAGVVADDEVDLLVFPIGTYGFGMPLNVPFACTAMEECRACGRLLTSHFVWRRGHVSHAGSLWTP